MAKHKNASGGQSQGSEGTPKQAAGGGPSRSPNTQAANRPGNANHGSAQKAGNAPAKHATSSGTGAAPPQNAPASYRPPNGTRSQGPGNGAPKSQGIQPSNFAARVEVMSGPRAMNEGTPKRNGNSPNNQAQGRGPQPNGHSKQRPEAPKPAPKHSQPLVTIGGLFPAPNPSLHSSAPPRPPHPGNNQNVHVPRAHGTSITGNKVFQDPSPPPKQSGHAHPHVQKTQNHVQTPPKASHNHQQQSAGKNIANSIIPKLQVAETNAQHSSRGDQSFGSSAKAPQANQSHNLKSHDSHQQHKDSLLVQETSNQGHKNTHSKPSTNDRRHTQPPSTQSSVLQTFFSFFSSGSEGRQDTPNKSQRQKGHKDTSPNPPMNNRRQRQQPTESVPVLPIPKESTSILSAGLYPATKGPGGPGNPSQKSQHKAAPTHSESRPMQEILSNKGHNLKDSLPKPPAKDRRQGQPHTESVMPKVSTELKDTGNQSSNLTTPPEPTAGSESLHSRTAKNFKKEGSNVKQGTAGIPQAAAAPMGWGQMLSSWFFSSAPPQAIDKGSQATSEAASNLRKGNDKPASETAALRKYLLGQRGPTLIWREGDTPRTVSAYSTLDAAPLPPPPKNELQNKVAHRTIKQNPHLFDVISTINVDAFQEYLKDHPNQPRVESVISGIKNGFWPFADTRKLPTTYDGSGRRSSHTTEERANFIQQQSEDEMNLGRWSKPFGDKLLPGMHSSPISAVPKSTPGKYRLVVDQSRGPHSLNSTIEKSQVKVKLDTVHDLGNKLLAVRKKHPKRKLTLWKSDVKSAYRQLPVHPLWQTKQAVRVNGQYHIDRCNTFGNRGGGWNWDSFISLVNWIGTEKKGVSDLLGYVDDNFGWEFAGRKEYYEPYKKHMPTKQARLLKLWDELGIPHDEEKQLSGPSLRILGYDVDANKMTVKVPDEKKEKVVKLLRSHAQEGKPYTVNELQTAAGSVNSALSLYPRIRPGVRVLYNEMAKQEPGTSKLMVTKDVARTLSELANFLEGAPPVRIQEQKKSVRSTKG